MSSALLRSNRRPMRVTYPIVVGRGVRFLIALLLVISAHSATGAASAASPRADSAPPTAAEIAALRQEIETLRARTQELTAQVGALRKQVQTLNDQLARPGGHARTGGPQPDARTRQFAP